MVRQILASLGVVAAITGLTSNVYAKPIVSPKIATNSAMRSGEVLGATEGRNIANDYPTSFSVTPNTNSDNSDQPISVNQGQRRSQASSLLGDKLKIDGGDSSSPENTLNPLRLNRENGEHDTQFKVQYQIKK